MFRPSAVVEGPIDEAVLARVALQADFTLGPVYGKRGKGHIRQQIAAYNQAAKFQPFLVLVDLDRDAECAVPLLADWLPDPAPGMQLRIAVRSIEAWLLADVDGISRFLGVSAGVLPKYPEQEPDPKRTLVALARRSRRAAIRADMVPTPNSGRAVGPGYPSRLLEFVSDHAAGWSPTRARLRAPSLDRCLERLRHWRP